MTGPLPSATPRRASRSGALAPLLLASWGLAWQWPRLDHPAILGSDEVVHQLATRAFHDTGLPMVYTAPLVDAPFAAWWDAHVFLHKPPLPFALGALLMGPLGPTPLPLRLVSLAASLAAALGLYWFGRRLLGRALALLLAASFLCLPFGYTLVQGYMFGDVTDCSLLGFLTLSMALLSAAIERDSAWLSAAAGGLCGCAYLCKSALALMPLGAVGTLAALGALGLAPRLRGRLVLSFAAAAVAVAAPWNVYSALRWPALYRWEARHTLGFLTDGTRLWARPLDAVFNEVNETELEPWPVAVFPLAGLWLLWTAVRRRETDLWLACLWLWGEWIPLSIAVVKVPAHAWGAAPAALLAVGLLLRDSLRRPWLAGASFGALGAGFALRQVPGISLIRRAVPPLFAQTAARPGLAEGLALAALASALAWAVARDRARHLPGLAAAAAAIWVGLPVAALSLQMRKLSFRNAAVDAYGDDLGRALAPALPANAILFAATHETPARVGAHALMFYSGRTTYPADEQLVRLARLEGLHPYLVTSLAQPYRRVEAVPGSAWLQAFDLDEPLAAPADLPPDLTPVNEQLGALDVLGVASARGDSQRDRYVFYVSSEAPLALRKIDVAFVTGDGAVERTTLHTEDELDWPSVPTAGPLGPALASHSHPARDWIDDRTVSGWFTLAAIGPPRARLRRLELLGRALPLP